MNVQLWTRPLGGAEFAVWPVVVAIIVAHGPVIFQAVGQRRRGLQRMSPWVYPYTVGWIPAAASLAKALGASTSAANAFVETHPVLLMPVFLTSLVVWGVAWAGQQYEARLRDTGQDVAWRGLAASYLWAFVVSCFAAGHMVCSVMLWYGRENAVGIPLPSYLVGALACLLVGLLLAWGMFWIAGVSLWQVAWPRSNRAILYFARQYRRLLRDGDADRRRVGVSRLVELGEAVRPTDRTASAQRVLKTIKEYLAGALVDDEHDDSVRTEIERALRALQGDPGAVKALAARRGSD